MLNLIDHGLHRQSQEREGSFQDVHDIVHMLPRLANGRYSWGIEGCSRELSGKLLKSSLSLCMSLNLDLEIVLCLGVVLSMGLDLAVCLCLLLRLNWGLSLVQALLLNSLKSGLGLAQRLGMQLKLLLGLR